MRKIRFQALLLTAVLLSTETARALPTCNYDLGGGDCGNGALTCAAGYNPTSCNGACVNSGFDSCAVYCTTASGCACDASYSPGNSVTIPHGATGVDIIAFCSCKHVVNNNTFGGGKTLMVPTKTSTEWSSFFNAYNTPGANGIVVTPGSCN